jgi:hypothetical protein
LACGRKPLTLVRVSQTEIFVNYYNYLLAANHTELFIQISQEELLKLCELPSQSLKRFFETFVFSSEDDFPFQTAELNNISITEIENLN